MIVAGYIDQEPCCAEMISILVFANCFTKHGVPESKYLCSEIQSLSVRRSRVLYKNASVFFPQCKFSNDIQIQVDYRLQFIPISQIFILTVWGPFSFLVIMDV